MRSGPADINGLMEAVERLQTAPGAGPKIVFTYTAYADAAAERFENAAQVSNYLGLALRVYRSGTRSGTEGARNGGTGIYGRC